MGLYQDNVFYAIVTSFSFHQVLTSFLIGENFDEKVLEGNHGTIPFLSLASQTVGERIRAKRSNRSLRLRHSWIINHKT